MIGAVGYSFKTCLWETFCYREPQMIKNNSMGLVVKFFSKSVRTTALEYVGALSFANFLTK